MNKFDYKYILNFLFKFIQSSIITILTFIIILLITIFNKNYVLTYFNSDYYDKLNNTLNEEMSSYLIQSGLDDSILNNVVDRETIRRTTEKMITSFYNNEDITINTSSVEETLTTNINNYIKANKIKNVSESDIELLVEKLTNVYKEELTYHDILNSYHSIFNKIEKVLKIVSIILIILVIINYLISKKYFKERNIISSLLTYSFISLFIIYYINSYTDISNIIIYNETISNLVKTIIYDELNIIKIVGLIYLIISIILIIYSTKIINELKKNPKIIPTTLFIIWLIVIFLFSSQDSISSTKTSDGVTTKIIEVATTITNKQLTEDEKQKKIEDSTWIVRKTAHFIEYLILGVLTIIMLKQYYPYTYKLIIASIIICILYASSDEIHQLFVSQRSCRLTDVLIDTVGSTFGIILFNIYREIKKIQIKKYDNKYKNEF